MQKFADWLFEDSDNAWVLLGIIVGAFVGLLMKGG